MNDHTHTHHERETNMRTITVTLNEDTLHDILKHFNQINTHWMDTSEQFYHFSSHLSLFIITFN